MKIKNNHNYLNKNIKYIKNGIITEYDMKNGGISILYNKNLISDKEYDYLMNKLNKEERNIVIGKWLKTNSDISIELMKGFEEARKLFFETNSIDGKDILSIKKDAIFLIDKIVKIENINDNYIFRKKNQYTSYINLSGKEFYYNLLNDKMDIKGVSKEALDIQKNYLFNFIKECLNLDANNKKEELIIKLLEFKNDYVTKNLKFNYYYDILFNCYLFNKDKMFLSIDKINDKILKENNYLNINTNLSILTELISNLI